jgi:hypothetical protein
VRTASGKTWIGVFAFGYPSGLALSRVISAPSPDRLCAVAKGRSYIVDVQEPDVWEEIPLFPMQDMRVILDHSLLVFLDFGRLAAYGIGGLAEPARLLG